MKGISSITVLTAFLTVFVFGHYPPVHTSTVTKTVTVSTTVSKYYCSTSTKKSSSLSTIKTTAKTSTLSTKKSSTQTSKKTSSLSSTKPASSTGKSTFSSSKTSPSGSTISVATSTKSSTAIPSLSPSSPAPSSSVSLPGSVSLPSVSLPTTTSLPVPVCVPPTSADAVQNGGFGEGTLNHWNFDRMGATDDQLFSTLESSYGVRDDFDANGNDKTFFTSVAQGFPSYSLSQTLCLVPGITYTYAYYVGMRLLGNARTTGCKLTVSANGDILQPARYPCGADFSNLPGNFGTCTLPPAESGDDGSELYERIQGTYVATAEETLVTFSYMCIYDSELEVNGDNLFDYFSFTRDLV